MDIALIQSFIIVSITLIVAPGPDVCFLIIQSLTYGRKRGQCIALGLSSGLIVHSLVAVAGLCVLLETFPVLMQVIKLLGATYLIYLAYQTYRQKIEIIDDQFAVVEQTPSTSLFHYYKRGFIMNVLNPKVALFFLALFPQFITKDAWDVKLQIILLAFIFILETLIIFNVIAIISGKMQALFLNKKALLFIKYLQITVLLFIALFFLL